MENEVWFDKYCWKNKGRLYRYFACVNLCFLGLGAFVCFDSVGALQEALMERFQISFSQFSLMYSVNSWPNVVLSFFGGILIDSVFGIRMGTVLYGGVFAAGHFIFSLGVLVTTYWCALLGRFISGMGAEFLYICLQIYSIQYFKGKELSMVMCMNISISRLGSSIIYAIADPILTDIRKLGTGSNDVGIVMFIVGVFTFLTIFGASILACMSPKSHDCKSTEQRKHNPKITWRDFIFFPLEFWLIIIIHISFTVSIYVFLPFTQEFFKTMYGMSVDSANSVTSFFSMVGAIISPFIGILIDKVGKRMYFSKVGLMSALIAHIILGFSSWTPYISLFILSLAYGLFNGSVVPMFAFLIPEYKLGTTYGVALSLINCAYALSIFSAGVIVDEYGYPGLEIFMIIFVLVGLIASIGLWIKDARGTGVLNMSPSQRTSFIEKGGETSDVMEPLKS